MRRVRLPSATRWNPLCLLGAGLLHGLVGCGAMGPASTRTGAVHSTAMEFGPRRSAGLPCVPLPTLGGRLLWEDLRVHGGWRLQRNMLTGHCRWLDPGDVRRAWGSRAACERFPPGSDSRTTAVSHDTAYGCADAPVHLVVLLHGLNRSRTCWQPLVQELATAGYVPMTIGYPSWMGGVDAHAQRIAAVLDQLDGAGEISFVTHSMGGLVLRRLLDGPGNWRARFKLQRCVMLAPPHQGSRIAARVAMWQWPRWLVGRVLDDLSPNSCKDLPAWPPQVPGLVVHGGTGQEGWNPFLPGDDDGTVSEAETWLPGTLRLWVRARHSAILANPEALRATVRFLQGTSTDRSAMEESAQPASSWTLRHRSYTLNVQRAGLVDGAEAVDCFDLRHDQSGSLEQTVLWPRQCGR